MRTRRPHPTPLSLPPSTPPRSGSSRRSVLVGWLLILALAIGSAPLDAQGFGLSVRSGPAYGTSASFWFGSYRPGPYFVGGCWDSFYDPWLLYRPACASGWSTSLWATSLWWGGPYGLYPNPAWRRAAYPWYAARHPHRPRPVASAYHRRSSIGVSVGILVSLGSWWSPYAWNPFYPAYPVYPTYAAYPTYPAYAGWYGWGAWPARQAVYVDRSPRWVVSPAPRVVRAASSTQFSSGAWVSQPHYKEDPRAAQTPQPRVAVPRPTREESGATRQAAGPRQDTPPTREATRPARQVTAPRQERAAEPETQALVESRPARPPVVTYGRPSTSTREETRAEPSTANVDRTPEAGQRRAAPRTTVVTPRASSRPPRTQVEAPTRSSAEPRTPTTRDGATTGRSSPGPSRSAAPNRSRTAAPSRSSAPSRSAAPSRATAPSRSSAPSPSAAPSRVTAPSRSSAPSRTASPSRSAPTRSAPSATVRGRVGR